VLNIIKLGDGIKGDNVVTYILVLVCSIVNLTFKGLLWRLGAWSFPKEPKTVMFNAKS
jgi:hypothetical protein